MDTRFCTEDLLLGRPGAGGSSNGTVPDSKWSILVFLLVIKQ